MMWDKILCATTIATPQDLFCSDGLCSPSFQKCLERESFNKGIATVSLPIICISGLDCMHLARVKFTRLMNIVAEKNNSLRTVETLVQLPGLLSAVGIDKST